MEPTPHLRKEKGNGQPFEARRSPSPKEEAEAIAIVINACFSGLLNIVVAVHRHEEDLLARKLDFVSERGEAISLNINLAL